MRLPLPQFIGDDRHPSHFAEVIETTTTEFLAQCLEPEDLGFPVMPPSVVGLNRWMTNRAIKFLL
jgi:hypothetical protein